MKRIRHYVVCIFVLSCCLCCYSDVTDVHLKPTNIHKYETMLAHNINGDGMVDFTITTYMGSSNVTLLLYIYQGTNLLSRSELKAYESHSVPNGRIGLKCSFDVSSKCVNDSKVAICYKHVSMNTAVVHWMSLGDFVKVKPTK